MGLASVASSARCCGLFNPKKGYAYPPVERIVRDTGFGDRTVWRAIKELATRGHVLIDRGGGRGHANAYHLNFETLSPAAGFKATKPCQPRPQTLPETPSKPCHQRQTNKKDSNMEDSNWSLQRREMRLKRKSPAATSSDSDTRARARERGCAP